MRKKFSKVKAVKDAAREKVGAPKPTKVVPNKRRQALERIARAEEDSYDKFIE